MSFRIEKQIHGKLGRTGVLNTPHGEIKTPAFVTVGTKATVKSLTPEEIKATGAQVVLANTYHLYLEPGANIIREQGGLGKFMGWNGPTMTDSGGFQVFSLGAGFNSGSSKFLKTRVPRSESSEPLAKIDDEGVTFKSYKDGSEHRFTPERSIEIQHDIGADIIFAFDECTSPEALEEYQKKAMQRTHEWAERSLKRHKSLLPNSYEWANKGQELKTQLFGVVQGGRHESLRKESAKVIGSMDFDGFGIGGSFDKNDIETVLEWVNSILPEKKPRHLLGIGEPGDLFGAVENGCDLFDCVAPTREARNGGLYTREGRINISNSKYRNDSAPIDSECPCYTCKNFTKSYVAHLFRSGEILSNTLGTIHNVTFFVRLVSGMREAILAGKFLEYKDEFFIRYRK